MLGIKIRFYELNLFVGWVVFSTMSKFSPKWDMSTQTILVYVSYADIISLNTKLNPWPLQNTEFIYFVVLCLANNDGIKWHLGVPWKAFGDSYI